jgi:dTDP-4-dehydrorhamnose reductase
MTILLSGGAGRLGTELKKLLPNIIAPNIKEWDITDADLCVAMIKKYQPDVVVHAAAYTDVAGAEKNKELCRRINVGGTRNVARAIIETAPATHLIYISTDYVFSGDRGNYQENDATDPVNFYAKTKLEGEKEAAAVRHHHIIRTSFKPRPFEHARACIDMWTAADYVDIVAKELALAIKHYDKLPDVIHIATARKSIFDLAEQTNPKVEPIKRSDIKSVILPKDTSLNISRWLKFKKTITL